jgi:hypothetical protein
MLEAKHHGAGKRTISDDGTHMIDLRPPFQTGATQGIGAEVIGEGSPHFGQAGPVRKRTPTQHCAPKR